MNKVALAVAILALSAIGAAAADMAPRYNKAHVAAPVATWNWTGFYIGGNVGGVWERDSGTSNFFDPNARGANSINNPQANSFMNGGFNGGVHAGYNWQMTQWVFGVEADWDWISVGNSFCRQTNNRALPCSDNNSGFLTLNAETEWLGSARGRVGYAWDRFLVYGTGGAAWGKIHTTINANCLVGGCASSALQLDATANFSNAQVGWVAGAGIEAMLTARWIVRAEYLHYDLGNVTSTLNLLQAPAFPQSATWSRSYRYDTIRAGLSYKFGGPSATY